MLACGGDPTAQRPLSPGVSGAAGASTPASASSTAGSIPNSPQATAGTIAPHPQPTIGGGPASGFVPPPAQTGVIFEWPETDPNAATNCRPGHYVGAYMCRLHIITMEGDGAFDLLGTVDMTLERTASGELLRIANGKFSSATAAVIPVFADVVGELNCSTSRFEGRLENGTFSVALGLPVPFTEGTFAGDLNADYDPRAAALTDGAWSMAGELDLFPGSCMGTWSARRVD